MKVIFHRQKALPTLAVLVALCGCAPGGPAYLQVSIPTPQGSSAAMNLQESLFSAPDRAMSPPSTVDGFSCYAVNVTAPGANCGTLNTTSLLTTSDQSAITLTVQEGPNLGFQMVGVQTPGPCNTSQTLSQLWNSYNPGNCSPGTQCAPSVPVFAAGPANGQPHRQHDRQHSG